jgi:hypothetical protein
VVLLLSQPKKSFREIKILSFAPMRIRKRQVPFPLSSLSPVPLSDPLLNRSPVVQLQLHDATHPRPAHPLGNLTHPTDRHAHFDNQPSDQPNQRPSPIGGGGSGLDGSDGAGGAHKADKKMKKDCLVSETTSSH